MKKSKLIYRANPRFQVLSQRDLATDNSMLTGNIQENDHALYLAYNGDQELNNLLPIDLTTANLLLSLSHAGELDHFMEKAVNRLLVYELLFDNILQVKAEKEFIGGSAWSRTEHSSTMPATALTKNAHISYNAIKYALHFRNDSMHSIAKKLYVYGTMPNDASISKETNTPQRFINWLGRAAMKSLNICYDKLPATKQNFWHYWQHKQMRDIRSLQYKLYISPTPEATPEVFEKVCRLCLQVRVQAFKIGANTQGIYRPDKLVLYFYNESDLRSFACLIIAEIDKAPAQVVPFAFPLSESGLLSFGIEPDQNNNISYRIFVTRLIARSIKACSIQHEPTDITHHLRRLCALGINTNLWNTFN